MHTLIDGDIVCHRCAASAENDPPDVAMVRMDKMMDEILTLTQAGKYSVFLSGDDNFRYKLYPEYKANRKNIPKPKHLETLRERAVVSWYGKLANGCEADDLIGVHANEETIIASIDKDLRQIPGRHYNLVSKVVDEVDQHQAWFNFYSQLILGDRSDNILGFDGIMRQSIPKFLQNDFDHLFMCQTEVEMFEYVYGMYSGGLGEQQMALNGQLLYIWRKENDSWDYENLQRLRLCRLEEEME